MLLDLRSGRKIELQAKKWVENYVAIRDKEEIC